MNRVRPSAGVCHLWHVSMNQGGSWVALQCGVEIRVGSYSCEPAYEHT